jgi:O-antigen ligase
VVSREAVKLREHADAVLVPFSAGVIAALALNALSIVLGHLDVITPYIQLQSPSWHGREMGLIAQPNHLGVLAVLAWAGAGYLRGLKRISAWLYMAATVVASLVCASTASRTAFGVSLIVSVLQLVSSWRSQGSGSATDPRISARELVSGFVLFFAIQAAWLVQPPPPAIESTEATAPLLRGGLESRVEMLRDAWLLGAQHPLLGVGFRNYGGARLFSLDGSMAEPNASQAHNLIAQIWAEFGLLGLACLAPILVAVAFAAVRFAKNARWTPASTLALCWVLALLAHSMVEHPLWFAFFLLPFAMMLGLLPQPEIKRKHAGSAPRVVTLFGGLLALGLCGLAAFDYMRSERLALSVLFQIRTNADHSAAIPRAETMRIANLTLFPEAAEVMQLRAMALDNWLPDLKLEVAERAMRVLGHAETMSRYIGFLAIQKRDAEATAFLSMIRRRSPETAAQIDQDLRALASSNPLLQDFVASMSNSVLPSGKLP